MQAGPDIRTVFDDALRRHQRGHLRRAERLYRQVLAINPQHADALHLLGVIASQTGRQEEALALIGAAIAIAPNQGLFRVNLGNVHEALGNAEQALECYRAAVALDPGFADAHKTLGRTLHRQGQSEEAVACYRAALSLRPDDADAAIELGNIFHALDRLDDAAWYYRRALAVRPNDAGARNNLGSVLYRRGQFEEAEACYRQALALDAACEPALVNLADVLREQGRLEEAIAWYRRTIALNPNQPGAYNNLGNAHFLLGQADAAIAAFRAALRLRPEDAELHSNLGAAHALLGQSAETIACCRTAIQLRPDYADAHQNLAHVLLQTGEMAEGWREYEWRWEVPPQRSLRRNFTQPQWMGEPGDGRTLLIHAEQGLGDTLQFCRYAPLARERGLRVIAEAPATLIRLLQGQQGIDRLVPAGETLPPFDLHCPMLSLPLALGTTLETVPGGTPYLSADPAGAAAWRARLAPSDRAGPRVGFAWAGSSRPDSAIAAAFDRRRSLAPERLEPLLAIPGLQFFSLQKDGPPAPPDLPLIDHMGAMQDFADTAALVANMDLVISVDSAVAHLAGAMGRPVCLLDRFDHCWRWLDGRRDSPWYPTLRVYRQPRPEDWDSVLAELAADLRALSEGWHAARTEWATANPG